MASKKSTSSSKTTKKATSVTTSGSTACKSKKINKELFVQFWGKEFNDAQLFKIAEECYRAGGYDDEIKDIKLYVKPEESKAYFTVNGSFSDNVILY